MQKMADLKGKRVSTGSPGSATEVMAFRVIEAAGLDKDKDMRRERLGVAESVNAIKDRKIDAFFWVGGLPTAAVTDLGATPNVKIKMIDHADVVDKMNAKYGGIYTAGVIPAKTYPGQEQDNADLRGAEHPGRQCQDGRSVAYDIVKTFIEKRDELVAVHGEATSIALDDQAGDELADSLASRGAEVFHGEGREDVSAAALRHACPSDTVALVVRLMAAGGSVFGLLGDRRPFGNDVLAHPLVVFFALVAAGCSSCARRCAAGASASAGADAVDRLSSRCRRLSGRQLGRRASPCRAEAGGARCGKNVAHSAQARLTRSQADRQNKIDCRICAIPAPCAGGDHGLL